LITTINPSPPENWEKILSINNLCFRLGYKKRYIKSIADNFQRYYYVNPKIIKGKLRELECTKGNFNIIQKKIHQILSKYPFPAYMMGVARNKSIIDNAKIHPGNKTLVTIDIKNCFPNTDDFHVFNMFRNQLGYSNKVSSLLTRLTTYKHHSPQGTHCSPVIVALCLLPLCSNIYHFCLDKGFNFSIWVDDIAISGNNPEIYISDYVDLFKKHGYACRNKKIKILKGGRTKIITGVGIKNNRLTISKNRVEECMKIIISIAKNSDKTGDKEIQSLNGKIAFIQKIDKKNANKIITFAKKLGVKLSS